MANFNLWNIPNLTPEALQDLKSRLKTTLEKPIENNPKINEKEIIDLKNKLNKQNLWVNDFFTEL